MATVTLYKGTVVDGNNRIKTWNDTVYNVSAMHLASQIPYENGDFTLTIQVGNVQDVNSVYKELHFTINQEVVKTCSINGMYEGDLLESPRDISITNNGYTRLTLYMNGQVITTMTNNGSKIVPKASLTYKIGNNLIELKSEDNVVRKAINVELLRNGEQTNINGQYPSDILPIPTDEQIQNEFPKPAENADFFTKLIYYVQYPFYAIGKLINTLFSGLSSLVTQIGNVPIMFSTVFTFLPPEMATIIGLGIITMMVIGILKSIRGK
jgi:hypothetical protein